MPGAERRAGHDGRGSREVKLSPIAVLYELGKLLSTLCLMNSHLLFAKLHSMILLSYCRSSLVACKEGKKNKTEKQLTITKKHFNFTFDCQLQHHPLYYTGAVPHYITFCFENTSHNVTQLMAPEKTRNGTL